MNILIHTDVQVSETICLSYVESLMGELRHVICIVYGEVEWS